MNNRDMFIAQSMDKLKPSDLKYVLDKLSDTELLYAGDNFKSPVVALVISILVGGLGIDRFYLGQIGLGFLKFLTLGGFGFWTVIDWFRIMGITKNRNLESCFKNRNINFSEVQNIKTNGIYNSEIVGRDKIVKNNNTK